MKKKMAIVLISVLVFSNSMVAFGATTGPKDATAKKEGETFKYYNGKTSDYVQGTTQETTNEQEVTASYTPDTTTVYSVDISWGNMQYSYTKGSATWDPKEHTYGGGVDGSWTLATPGNAETDDAVTVGNHSNDVVYAEIKCDFVGTYSNLVGEFTKIAAQCSNDGVFEFGNNTNGTKSNTPKAKFKLSSAVSRGKTFSQTTGLPQGKAQFAIDGDPGSSLSGTKIGTITVTISNTDPSTTW